MTPPHIQNDQTTARQTTSHHLHTLTPIWLMVLHKAQWQSDRLSNTYIFLQISSFYAYQTFYRSQDTFYPQSALLSEPLWTDVTVCMYTLPFHALI